MLSACGQYVFGVADQVQCCPCVPAACLALGLDSVQPGEQLGRGSASACVGAGGDHPLDGPVPIAVPCGNERGVGEDRGPEQRVVGLACGLEST